MTEKISRAVNNRCIIWLFTATRLAYIQLQQFVGGRESSARKNKLHKPQKQILITVIIKYLTRRLF